MQPSATHYPDWKAPSEDGQIAIWPAEPHELIEQTLENQKVLSAADVRIQMVPLRLVRESMRRYIGHRDPAQPLVMAGHQAELYHTGVWAKDVLIDLLAKQLGGSAFHIAVDTDAAKHFVLRWPSAETIAISDDPTLNNAAWSGLVAPPTPEHLNQIRARLDQAIPSWGFVPGLSDLLRSLRRLSIESLNLPMALTNAIYELDWNLGLRHHVLLASPIWDSEPFLLFVHDLIANADLVAANYNQSLRAYRVLHGIKSQMRPMPDLVVSDGAVEVPFWLDDLNGGRRTRPSVFRSDRGWMLDLHGGGELAFERGLEGWEAAARFRRWLGATGQRMSPRALTLTMFCRLFLADQFLHGIGGARYDQVTDSLIQSYYGIPAPRFGVTTATLYFPTALGEQRVCLPCVKREGHRLKHDVLGDRKRRLVSQIGALPRYSAQRQEMFFQMHAELAAAASSSPAFVQWERRFQEAHEKERQEQTLFDRELFFGLQPAKRLGELIEGYRRATGFHRVN